MKKTHDGIAKLYKYDFTEWSFNIEDVCFSIYTFHQKEGSYVFNKEIVKSSFSPSFREQYSMHRHPYYEIFFSHAGNYHLETVDEAVELDKDSLIVIPPVIQHISLTSSRDGDITFNFSFKKNNVKTENQLYTTLTSLFSSEYVHIKNNEKLYDLVKKLESSIEHGSIFMISRYFYALITEILNSTNMLLRKNPDEMLRDSYVSRYRKIKTLIEFFYDENIDMEFVAKTLNLSTRQISRVIKEEFGCTFQELISRKRMDIAGTFLETTNMKISEIATSVGYNSITAFNNAFKKHYGMLPSEYRKSKDM